MPRFAFLVLAAALALAAPVRASALTFSDASSDSTPASTLDTVLDIQVAGSTLTPTLTNTSTSCATHSDGNADVTSAWPLVADGGPGDPTHVGSFGTFDFTLDGPVGQTGPALIGSGESIVFVLAIRGPGPFSAADFQELTSGPNPSLAAGVGGVGSRIAQPQTTASSHPLPTNGSRRPHRVEREDLR